MRGEDKENGTLTGIEAGLEIELAKNTHRQTEQQANILCTSERAIFFCWHIAPKIYIICCIFNFFLFWSFALFPLAFCVPYGVQSATAFVNCGCIGQTNTNFHISTLCAFFLLLLVQFETWIWIMILKTIFQKMRQKKGAIEKKSVEKFHFAPWKCIHICAYVMDVAANYNQMEKCRTDEWERKQKQDTANRAFVTIHIEFTK